MRRWNRRILRQFLQQMREGAVDEAEEAIKAGKLGKECVHGKREQMVFDIVLCVLDSGTSICCSLKLIFFLRILSHLTRKSKISR